MMRDNDTRVHTYVFRNGADTPRLRAFDPLKSLILTVLAILLVLSLILPGRLHVGSGTDSQDAHAPAAPATR
jgi:hypothetical protein